MRLIMGCARLTTYPKLCRGTPILDEALMAEFQPEVGEMYHGGKRVMSPDTPYAAACAQNAIYFIDQRYDVESARHIKEQLENLVSDQNGHWFIDEIEATAERKDAAGKTLFTFNPPYARVLFENSMNSRNPSLKLPVHEPAGDWLVVYDTKNAAIGGKAQRIGTGLNPRDSKKKGQEDKPCNINDNGHVDSHRGNDGLVHDGARNAAGSSSSFKAAMDTPRFEGETDFEYYQRMDTLHWG